MSRASARRASQSPRRSLPTRSRTSLLRSRRSSRPLPDGVGVLSGAEKSMRSRSSKTFPSPFLVHAPLVRQQRSSAGFLRCIGGSRARAFRHASQGGAIQLVLLEQIHVVEEHPAASRVVAQRGQGAGSRNRPWGGTGGATAVGSGATIAGSKGGTATGVVSKSLPPAASSSGSKPPRLSPASLVPAQPERWRWVARSGVRQVRAAHHPRRAA